jgi:hypothetical protein
MARFAIHQYFGIDSGISEHIPMDFGIIDAAGLAKKLGFLKLIFPRAQTTESQSPGGLDRAIAVGQCKVNPPQS